MDEETVYFRLDVSNGKTAYLMHTVIYDPNFIIFGQKTKECIAFRNRALHAVRMEGYEAEMVQISYEEYMEGANHLDDTNG
jgi:hypothetical protein